MSDFKAQLKKLDACTEAVVWVGDKTLEQAWAKCRRGDWMLWLAGKAKVDRKLLVLAACDCAEPALKYVKAGETRPAHAIKTARAWCVGEATIEDVKVAADNADNADAAYAAAVSYAVSYAAYAYAYASASAASAAYAVSYAVSYASASVSAASAASAYASRIKSLAHSAKLVRKRIPVDVIQKAMEVGNV